MGNFKGTKPYEDEVHVDAGLVTGFRVTARYYTPAGGVRSQVKIIAFHGLGGLTAGYDPEYQRLSDDSACPLVAVHLPSHGQTDDIPWGCNASEFMVAAMGAFIDHEAPGRVIIIGHSLGAIVAPFVAARLEAAGPGRVLSVVMERPPFGTIFLDTRPLIPTVVAGKLAPLGPDMVCQATLAWALSAIRGDGRRYLGGLGQYVTHPPRVLSGIMALWTSEPVHATLEELRRHGVPVDAVFALGDTAIPVPWRRLARGRMPVRVTVVLGTHCSNILGIGPSYQAVSEPVLAAAGLGPEPTHRFRFLRPRPLRICREIAGRRAA